MQVDGNIGKAFFNQRRYSRPLLFLPHLATEIHQHGKCQVLEKWDLRQEIRALTVEIAKVKSGLRDEAAADRRAGRQGGEADKGIFFLPQFVLGHSSDPARERREQGALQQLPVTGLHGNAERFFEVQRHMECRLLPLMENGLIQQRRVKLFSGHVIYKKNIPGGNFFT